MTEEKIRQQTKVIWDAYSSFTGDEKMPDVAGFLLVREAAIKEMSMGVLAVPSTEQKTAYKTRGAMSEPASEKEKEKTEKRRQQPAQPKTAAAGTDRGPAPAPEPVQASDPQQETVSDFDILRRMKDPWN